MGSPVLKSNGRKTVSFGLFQLDLDAGELRRSGIRVKLQEQPFQVLSVLLERPGEVVSREELRTRLWASDTFVDFDHSLNAAVRRLRDALGDTAENPRFIETVARRGYRFLAPVNGTALPAATTERGPHHWPWRWILAGLTTALLAGVIVGWHAGHRVSASALPLEQRLTANAPDYPVTDGVISPDGKYLAFADLGGFYLKQVETGETHRLPLPEGFNAKPRSWFPDGTHLLATWVAGPQEPTSIWEISTIGGAPRKLINEGAWPSVSPDGSKIAFLVGSTGSKKKGVIQIENPEIWIMQANGEAPHKVSGDLLSVVGPAAWSPDGKSIAYVRAEYTDTMPYVHSRIEILNLSTNSIRTLMNSSALGSTVAWTANWRLIYSLSEPTPNQNDSNLWAISVDADGRSKGSPTRLTRGSGSASLVSVTSDGKLLVFFRRTMEPDVYVTDLVDKGQKLSVPTRLTLDERSDFPYTWTLDSRSVVFVSDRNGTYSIFKQSIEDTQPELLLRSSENLGVARLTPDGSSILYLATPINENAAVHKVRLMRASLSGGSPQTLAEMDGINNHQCARAPFTVCILSVLDNGAERFYSFNPTSGVERELKSSEVKSESAWDFNWSLSPDGKTLATAKRVAADKGPQIQLVDLSTGTERAMPITGWGGINSIDWAADGKSLWVTAYAGTGFNTLLNVTVDGRILPMLSENKMMLGWAIPSPDGKHLALWEASGSSNIWMLKNF